ncbi:hypothetical protein BVG16_05755 [Paenibacillus selenitireducens]|uniref:Uncharacterized protein n=1 Tax=Paenibacillus selenitireducens TaxID=1324314 RepID=A0A1T2XK93_9BACL|nr:hypothetical protein [Paenibacillus selenitireducens]OPA80245.1 hypothetical protein BVG16_05755 [Paenibacillus selenitireducens]
MAEKVNEYADIDKRVSLFIEGKHGKIGIIIPDHAPTYEEWKEFRESLVEIALNIVRNKQISLKKETAE